MGEDFMDIAIAHALLSCFGIVFPMVASWAFVGNLILYRLYAYRMTHVTCRPYPQKADGIGLWHKIFEGISQSAVVINLMIACFVKEPIRREPLWKKLFIFTFAHFALRHGSDLVLFFADTPDVLRIEDYNNIFLTKVSKHKPPEVSKDAMHNTAAVDIGLGGQQH